MPIRHIAAQGDSLASLALRYGFAPATIADHPDNADLVSRRGDLNILAPGDTVVIPDRREKVVLCVTTKSHVFRRRGVPMVFRVQLLDGRKPRANVPYVLEVDGIPLEGSADGEGRIERYIPNDARQGRLIVDRGVVDVPLQFGHMDPIGTPAGVQKRLVNLGFSIQDATGVLGDTTAGAVRAFQLIVGIAATGVLDDETRAELARCHDKPGAYESALEGAAKVAGSS
jgi:N-acetylmuramoyl-L-alanine amidase